jgi:hypothetical protein
MFKKQLVKSKVLSKYLTTMSKALTVSVLGIDNLHYRYMNLCQEWVNLGIETSLVPCHV